MAVDFGTALAQGLTQGLGQAGQQYVGDMRRARINQQQMDDTLNNFKKQSVYSARLQEVQQQNVTTDRWRMQAAKSTGDIVREGAFAASKGLSPLDKPMFIRDYMKRNNGITKADALVQQGYVMADYSSFADDPTLMEAIPKANLVGSDSPDSSMSEIYKYNPMEMQEIQQAKDKKVTAYTQKRDDDLQTINSVSAINNGARLSDAAAKTVWKMAGGAEGKMVGNQLTNVSTGLVQKWLASDVLVNTGTVIKLRSEVSAEDDASNVGTGQWDPSMGGATDDQGAVAGRDLGPTDTTKPMISSQVFEDPTKTEMDDAKDAQRVNKEVIDLGTKSDKAVHSFDSMNGLAKSLGGLSQDAKTILFGGDSWRGALSLSDTAQKLAAKAGVKGAKEARAFLAQLESVVSVIKHDKYGSAQSNTEMANWAKELGNPSILQNPETLLQQIQEHSKMAVTGIDSMISNYGDDTRAEYIKRHPKLAEHMEKSSGGQNGQVSDLTSMIAKMPTQDQAAIKDMLASGKATEQDVRDYYNSLNK